MADSLPPLIKVTNVHQDFKAGDEVISPLKGVSFEINNNSFNIVYGQSGSGKSTLLNILTGLQRPTRGKITFKDEDIYNFKPDRLARFRAQRVGIIYQQNYWVHSLNVLENVAMPLYFLGYTRPMAAEMALIALERVGMQSYAEKYPVLLSGGEQQRIATARALVNDPLLIIADEPTGSLDTKNGDMVMDLLRKAHDDSLRTIILVTHNMEYLPLADHLLHIQDGEIQVHKQGTIQATTDNLMKEMKARIDRLAASKPSSRKLT